MFPLTKKYLDQIEPLLQAQSAGKSSALKDLHQLVKQVRQEFTEMLFAKEKSAKDQSFYDLHAIMDEWDGMFSFKPGRTEGLPAIIDLIAWLQQPSPQPSNLYEHPRWRELVDLRGPIEGVGRERCETCKSEYFTMITNGFVDLVGHISYPSGDVVFQSSYNDAPLPPPPKAGTPYKRGCLQCEESKGKNIGSLSPYEYFATRKYIVVNDP